MDWHDREGDLSTVARCASIIGPSDDIESVSPLTMRNVAASSSGSACRGPPAEPSTGCSREYRTRSPERAVAHDARDGLRQVMRIEDDVAHPLTVAGEHALDQRAPRQRHRRFGDQPGKGSTSRGATERGQHGEEGRQHG